MLADSALNARTVTPSPAVTFYVDSTVPVIGNVVVTYPKRSKVPGFDQVQVSFDLSEDVGSGLSALVDGQALTCDAWHATSPSHVCTRVVQASDVAGIKAIAIQASDAAGNTGFGGASVEYDFTPPTAKNAAPSLASYKAGASIEYRVDVSEPLLGTPGRPVLHVARGGVEQAGFFAAPSSETATSFAYSRSVAGLTDGAYVVTVDLTDQTGNTTTGIAGGTFAVDSAAPSVTLLAPATGSAYSEQPGHDTLTVQLDTENVDAAPGGLVVLGGGRALTCGAYAASSPRYTCSRTIDSGDTEGATSVWVQATDAAGNQGSASVGIVLDFTPPAVGSSAVVLTRPSGCTLGSVGKVGLSATATLDFTVSELLSKDPVVSSPKGTWTIAKNAAKSSGLFYEYTLTLTAAGAPDQGSVTPQVVLSDAVGNASAPLALPALAIDTVPPAAPDTATVDRIVYRRTPWGSDASGGVADFAVVSQSGAIVDSDGAVVVAYDKLDPTLAVELGRAVVSGTSFGTMSLTRADHTDVYLAVYDQGCNRSVSVVRVLDVDWIATMGGKVPGSILQNPHRFEARPVFVDALLQPGLQASDGLGVVGTPPLLTTAADGRWTAPSSAVEAPSLPTAYDSARARVVLPAAAPMEWDGVSWTTVVPLDPEGDGNPLTGLYFYGTAYDSNRGKVVLFGGQGDASAPNAETWEWDGVSWAHIVPLHSPSPRNRHAMAYDSRRGVVVLFGGQADLWTNGETWEWDGADWTNPTPSTHPIARREHAMAYDSARQRVVLFGGSGDVVCYMGSLSCADTWEWDGTTWTDRSPAGVQGTDFPSQRYGAAFAFDRKRNRAVLFGGATDAYTNVGDTWEWDGSSWAKMTPADPEGDGNPAAASPVYMSYDAARGQVVLAAAGTWLWDGTSWAKKPAASPSPVFSVGSRAASVYDGARGNVLFFGIADDTWTWSGSSWTKKSPGSSPGVRDGATMAFDSYYGKVLLVGGEQDINMLADTWQWDGANWTPLTPTLSPPRELSAAAYDTGRHRVVLFGGTDPYSDDFGDTWEWDGSAWQEITPTDDYHPALRSSHAMAYDPTRQRVVLFGGQNDGGGVFGDVWEWDGATWTNPALLGTPGIDFPSPRYGHTMVYDPVRAKVVLFGGSDATGHPMSDTWEWDGTSWARHGALVLDGDTSTPPPNVNHLMAFDTTRGEAIVYGGNAGAGMWRRQGGASSRPVHVMQTSFTTAGVSTTPTWKSVTATFAAGGSGATGAAGFGASLMVWDEGTWQTVDGNSADSTAPQTVTWTTSDAAVLRRLFFGPQQTLGFAVTSKDTSGTSAAMAQVATDYAEVTVRYSLR